MEAEESDCIVPVVIGALGAVSDEFDKHIEKLGTTIRLEVIQKTSLLGKARLLKTFCPFRERTPVVYCTGKRTSRKLAKKELFCMHSEMLSEIVVFGSCQPC